MSISSCARAYADALDRLELARQFVSSMGKNDYTRVRVQVDWADGSACPGYDVMAREISTLVEGVMRTLTENAVEKMENECRSRLQELRIILSSGETS